MSSRMNGSKLHTQLGCCQPLGCVLRKLLVLKLRSIKSGPVLTVSCRPAGGVLSRTGFRHGGQDRAFP